jgi:hypothetical protein
MPTITGEDSTRLAENVHLDAAEIERRARRFRDDLVNGGIELVELVLQRLL